MPYKTGKLKGELLVSEIRKLVRLHNKLSKIKIPPRSSRDDIIKIVESNGYKVDHKNEKLTATRMNKDLTLKEAQETFPVKKREKKEPPKPVEKPKPKKEDEVRPAKKPFPPIPKNIRGKRINVKFGKPATKERISTGVIAEGRLIEQPKKQTPKIRIKIKKEKKVKEPTGKKVKKAVEKIEAEPKKEEPKKTPVKKPASKKAEPKKAELTKNEKRIMSSLNSVDDDLSRISQTIRSNPKFNINKATLTEKQVFKNSMFDDIKNLDSMVKNLDQSTFFLQNQEIKNKMEDIKDKIPFIKDQIKGLKPKKKTIDLKI